MPHRSGLIVDVRRLWVLFKSLFQQTVILFSFSTGLLAYFVGYDSNESLISRSFDISFWSICLSGVSKAHTGPCWCYVRRQEVCLQVGYHVSLGQQGNSGLREKEASLARCFDKILFISDSQLPYCLSSEKTGSQTHGNKDASCGRGSLFPKPPDPESFSVEEENLRPGIESAALDHLFIVEFPVTHPSTCYHRNPCSI